VYTIAFPIDAAQGVHGHIKTDQIVFTRTRRKEKTKKKHSKLLPISNKHPISLRQCDHEYVFYRTLTLTARFSWSLRRGHALDLKNDPRNCRFLSVARGKKNPSSVKIVEGFVDPNGNEHDFRHPLLFTNAGRRVHWHNLKRMTRNCRRKEQNLKEEEQL
jgi:hypothetical protein